MNDTYELVFELDEQDRITSRIVAKAAPAKAPTPASVCTPKAMLDEFSAQHPGIWKDVDKMRNHIARNRAVPSWCFMPEDGWITLVFSLLADGDMEGFLSRIATDTNAIARCERMASEAAFFGAWRTTQGVYRFDPTLYGELVATPVTGPIPTDILKRLPEWAVYVETPGLFHPNGLPLLGVGATGRIAAWPRLEQGWRGTTKNTNASSPPPTGSPMRPRRPRPAMRKPVSGRTRLRSRHGSGGPPRPGDRNHSHDTRTGIITRWHTTTITKEEEK